MMKDSFREIEDAKTRQNMGDPDWEHDWATGRFTCLLKCTKQGCAETCAVAGNYDTWLSHEQFGDWMYASGRPASITPPPPMITVPEGCPQAIREEVVAALRCIGSTTPRH
jgi:hypothetical protein